MIGMHLQRDKKACRPSHSFGESFFFCAFSDSFLRR